jgi:sRNA-binding carbon storage regulator CsrA
MALMLGRNPGEKVIIQDDQEREIEIKVIKADSGLKLRITAPPEFNIVRGEIYDDNNS